MKKLLALLLVAITALFGCSDANIASSNISKAADNFEINRRVLFYNGITDVVLLTIEGFCSLDSGEKTKSVTVTCKTAENQYKKHFLGLSDNVTFFAEQIDSSDVSAYHYRVIFKPVSVIPDIEIKGMEP